MRLKCEARARLGLARLCLNLSSCICGARTRDTLATPVAYVGGEGSETGGGVCLRTRHVSFVSRRVRLFNHFNLEAVAVAEAETELEIVAVVGRSCCCCCCHFWGCRKGDTVSGYALSHSPLSLSLSVPFAHYIALKLHYVAFALALALSLP